jgi:hypothetical protein
VIPRPVAATGRSAVAAAFGALVAAIALATPVLAASPSPTGAVGGDPRSAGQGPGLVGDPVAAILVVVVIGLAAVGLTLLYVKLTGGRRA